MAAITFAARLNPDGSLTLPAEAIETLGLHPGDAVQVSLQPANGSAPSTIPPEDQESSLPALFAELLEAGKNVKREPGKPLANTEEEAIGAMIAEKYRKQGLKV